MALLPLAVAGPTDGVFPTRSAHQPMPSPRHRRSRLAGGAKDLGVAPVSSRGRKRSRFAGVAAGHAVFRIVIPRELAIDSTVEIAVNAQDRKAQHVARTSVVGVVRKRKLRMPGQLTRAVPRQAHRVAHGGRRQRSDASPARQVRRRAGGLPEMSL